MPVGRNWKPRFRAHEEGIDLRQLTLIILLLLGFSWVTSLSEGLCCDEEEQHHGVSAVLEEAGLAHDATHVCHAGSCHFGHCGHIDRPLISMRLVYPPGFPDPGSPPYSFALPTEPFDLPMRPPLDA
jgi:hypothetical protein